MLKLNSWREHFRPATRKETTGTAGWHRPSVIDAPVPAALPTPTSFAIFAPLV